MRVIWLLRGILRNTLIINGRIKNMSEAFDNLSAAIDANTALITAVAADVADAKVLIQGLRDTVAAGGTVSDAQINGLQAKLADADSVLSGAADALTGSVKGPDAPAAPAPVTDPPVDSAVNEPAPVDAPPADQPTA